MVFRVSAADAEIIAPEFHPLPAHELLDQSPYRGGPTLKRVYREAV
jgi:hypothetical protein